MSPPETCDDARGKHAGPVDAAAPSHDEGATVVTGAGLLKGCAKTDGGLGVAHSWPSGWRLDRPTVAPLLTHLGARPSVKSPMGRHQRRHKKRAVIVTAHGVGQTGREVRWRVDSEEGVRWGGAPMAGKRTGHRGRRRRAHRQRTRLATQRRASQSHTLRPVRLGCQRSYSNPVRHRYRTPRWRRSLPSHTRRTQRPAVALSRPNTLSSD